MQNHSNSHKIIVQNSIASCRIVHDRIRSCRLVQKSYRILQNNEESYKVMKNRAESYCILQSHRELYKIVQNRITSCCIVQNTVLLNAIQFSKHEAPCYSMQSNSLNMKRASRSHAKTGHLSKGPLTACWPRGPGGFVFFVFWVRRGSPRPSRDTF